MVDNTDWDVRDREVPNLLDSEDPQFLVAPYSDEEAIKELVLIFIGSTLGALIGYYVGVRIGTAINNRFGLG